MSNLINAFRDFINNRKKSFNKELNDRNSYVNTLLNGIVSRNGTPILPNEYKDLSLDKVATQFNKIYNTDITSPPIRVIKTSDNFEIPLSNKDFIDILQCNISRNNSSNIEDISKNELMDIIKNCQPPQNGSELSINMDDIVFAVTCSPNFETIEEITEPTISQDEFKYEEDGGDELDVDLSNGLKIIDDIFNKIKIPQKYIVISNIGGVVNIKNRNRIGERGSVVLTINDIEIPIFFNQSRILEFFVNDGDVIDVGQKLYMATEIGVPELEIERTKLKDRIINSNKLQPLRNELDALLYKRDLVDIFKLFLENTIDLWQEFITNNTTVTRAELIGIGEEVVNIKNVYENIAKWTNNIGVNSVYWDNVNYINDFRWSLDFLDANNGEIIDAEGNKIKVTGKLWDLRDGLGKNVLKLEQNESFQENFNKLSSDNDRTALNELETIKNIVLTISENIAKINWSKRRDIINIKKDLDKVSIFYIDIITKIDKIKNEINTIELSIKEDDNQITPTPYTVKNINGEDVKILYYPISNEGNEVEEDIQWRNNPRSNEESPQITDRRWWVKFCKNASIMNLIPIFWPVGLLIPTPAGITKIPMPILWNHLKVIQTPVGIVSMGFAICGVAIAPWVCFINASPFQIGPIRGNASWLIGGIRPMKKIKDDHGSKLTPLHTVVNIAGFRIDMRPMLSLSIPFIQDDYPPWERLSLKNIPHLLFLTQWCRAGKKSQGFFENAI